MNFIVSMLVAVKGILFLWGVAQSDAGRPAIEPRYISVVDSQVVVSFSIRNAFPPELRDLTATGTEILLYTFIEIRQNNNDSLLARAVVEKRIIYDVINRHFAVAEGGGPSMIYAVLDSALAATADFNRVPVVTASALQRKQQYVCVIYGILGKTAVAALQDRPLDLMYYWDYRRPTAKTAAFYGTQLLEPERIQP